MAETTRPARTRKATPAKAAPAKAAPAKAAAAKATETEETPARPDAVVELAYVGDTKNWSKWAFPEGGPNGTGNLYAPLGTTAVRVALYGVPEA